MDSKLKIIETDKTQQKLLTELHRESTKLRR
jgi:hypothetical protein